MAAIPVDVKEITGTAIPAAVAEEAMTEEATTEEVVILTADAAEESGKMTVVVMTVKGEDP